MLGVAQIIGTKYCFMVDVTLAHKSSTHAQNGSLDRNSSVHMSHSTDDR